MSFSCILPVILRLKIVQTLSHFPVNVPAPASLLFRPYCCRCIVIPTRRGVPITSLCSLTVWGAPWYSFWPRANSVFHVPMYKYPFQLQLNHSAWVPPHLGSCHASCPERPPHTSASRSLGQSGRAPSLPPVVSLLTHPLMMISAPSKLAEP